MDNNVQYLHEPFENSDIAGYRGPGWYFWDETQAGCYGPYNSKEEAEWWLEEYARYLSCTNDGKENTNGH
jgi:hypothetical protein